jgi:AcrR family transcriptional regulator
MRKESTDQKIRQAFLQELKDTPAGRIKVSTLAKKAGISRGTFYTYYDSVYDVLEDIEDRLFAGIPETSDPLKVLDHTQLAREALIIKLSYIRNQFPVFKLLMGPNGDPYFQYQLGRFFTPLMQDYLPQLESYKLALLNQALNGARMNIINWWVSHPDDVTIDQLANFLTTFIQTTINAYK